MKSVAVVGASGAVGDVMIRLLEERKFPVGSIKFLASERSAGKTVDVPRRDLPDRAADARGVRGRRHRPVEHARRRSRGSTARSPRGPARWSSTTRAPSGWTPTSRWSSPRSTRTTSPGTRGSSPTRTARRSRWSSPSSRCTTPSGSGGWSSAPTSRSRAPGRRACTSSQAQTEAHVDGREPPRAVQVRPPDRRSTASRRSTTSSPTATPRKR